MSNMSYCRFRNTASDLTECLEVLNEGDASLSKEEGVALKNMITDFHTFMTDNELLNEDGSLNDDAVEEFIYNSQE